MTADERRARLMEAIERFGQAVESLPDESFLREVDGRSPRDVVAHLIGWNRYTIEGEGELQRGELPSYLVDPGEDFGKVNAESMRRYASRDKGELLGQLRASTRELDQFLRALSPAEWGDNHGVTWRDHPVTTGWLVRALVHDYNEHRREIENWPRQAAGA